MTKLIRTFHPVGFGAFYTEVHENKDDDSSMTIVYDCGTKTAGVDIEGLIKLQFPVGKNIIDILFISHFDEDHINGIQFLKKHCIIKKIIIPYIPKVDRTLFVYAKNLNEYYQLIVNTEDFFDGNAEIVRVMSEQDGPLLNNNQENIMQSGNRLPLLPVFSNWVLIPFNYDYAEQISTLKKVLTAKGVTYEQLREKDYIINNIDRIKDAYKSIYKGNKQNEISLTLFSGSMKSLPLKICYTFKGRKFPGMYLRNLNCLYLGDASLKKRGFINKLRERLRDFYNEVDTIQIPHHGSANNFKKEILSSGSFAIISCDSKHYKLPSDSVVKEITEAGSTLVKVTDDVNTEFIELGYY